jgi:hypothetical protein
MFVCYFDYHTAPVLTRSLSLLTNICCQWLQQTCTCTMAVPLHQAARCCTLKDASIHTNEGDTVFQELSKPLESATGKLCPLKSLNFINNAVPGRNLTFKRPIDYILR